MGRRHPLVARIVWTVLVSVAAVIVMAGCVAFLILVAGPPSP
jgi:hypothetical protein